MTRPELSGNPKLREFLKVNGIAMWEVDGLDGYDFRKGKKRVRVYYFEYPDDKTEHEEYLIRRAKPLADG